MRANDTHTIVAAIVTFVCMPPAGGSEAQVPSHVDTSLLVGADVAALEEMLADAEGAHELALRLRLRQRSMDLDQLAVYRRAQWTSPAGTQFLHVVAERDAGEPDWHDFVAVHGSWRLSADLQSHFGDLRPGFAQGIVFSRSGRRGSGSPSPAMRGDSDLLGYRASGENHSLRGLGLRVRRHRLAVTLLAGELRRDARFDTAGAVISLPDGGRHVTGTERAGKDLLTGIATGLRLRWMQASCQFGMTLHSFSAGGQHLDLRRRETRPFAFAGRRQRMVGVDAVIANGGRRTRSAFVEIAVDDRSGWASVGGGRMTWGGTRLDAQGRFYSPGFHSFFGGSASATGMQNELGYSLAAQGRRGTLLRWRLFSDRYRRPQHAVTFDGPVASSVLGGVLRCGLGRRWKLETTLQHRQRWRPLGAPHDVSRTLRVDAIWSDAKPAALRLRLRGGGRRVRIQSEAPQQGSNFSLSWRHKRAAYDYVQHVSRFDTESYDARIYEYERDFPGAVSIRALYGDGWRAYAMVQRRWRDGVSVAARWRYERDPERGRVNKAAGLQIDYVTTG